MIGHLGRLTMTYVALAGLLRLPPGHVITAIAPQTGDDVANQRLHLIVSGPMLPAHIVGEPVVNVGLTVHTDGRSYFS